MTLNIFVSKDEIFFVISHKIESADYCQETHDLAIAEMRRRMSQFYWLSKWKLLVTKFAGLMIGLNDEIQTFKDPSSVTSGKIKVLWRKYLELSVWSEVWNLFYLWEKYEKENRENNSRWLDEINVVIFNIFLFLWPKSPPNLVRPSQSKNNVYNCIFIT